MATGVCTPSSKRRCSRASRCDVGNPSGALIRPVAAAPNGGSRGLRCAPAARPKTSNAGPFGDCAQRFMPTDVGPFHPASAVAWPVRLSPLKPRSAGCRLVMRTSAAARSLLLDEDAPLDRQARHCFWLGHRRLRAVDRRIVGIAPVHVRRRRATCTVAEHGRLGTTGQRGQPGPLPGDAASGHARSAGTTGRHERVVAGPFRGARDVQPGQGDRHLASVGGARLDADAAGRTGRAPARAGPARAAWSHPVRPASRRAHRSHHGDLAQRGVGRSDADRQARDGRHGHRPNQLRARRAGRVGLHGHPRAQCGAACRSPGARADGPGRPQVAHRADRQRHGGAEGQARARPNRRGHRPREPGPASERNLGRGGGRCPSSGGRARLAVAAW